MADELVAPEGSERMTRFCEFHDLFIKKFISLTITNINYESDLD